MEKALWELALELTADSMRQGMAPAEPDGDEFAAFVKAFETDFKERLNPQQPLQALKRWTADGETVLRSAESLGTVAAALAGDGNPPTVRREHLARAFTAVKDKCPARLIEREGASSPRKQYCRSVEP